jgi:hypothetical protein
MAMSVSERTGFAGRAASWMRREAASSRIEKTFGLPVCAAVEFGGVEGRSLWRLGRLVSGMMRVGRVARRRRM